MNPRAPQGHNVVTQSLAQIGNCGLFLLTLLAAIPRSFRYVRETIRQLWFVGADVAAVSRAVDLRWHLGQRHGGGAIGLS
jgi:ABC-type transporter Mla maintaining outer membrane lipid asymmetry permease subunit MlaE